MKKYSFYLPIGIILVIAGLFVFIYPMVASPAGRFGALAAGACNETDYGRDPFTYGEVASAATPGQIKQDVDYCKTDGMLVEFYCDRGASKSVEVSCSFYGSACSNGVCILNK
jgi:hypothetical protein